MKIKYFIILLCINFLASGCGSKSPVLATVSGEKITLKEFEEQIRNLPPAYQAVLITPEQKERFLDNLILEKLMIQKAIREGLHRKKEIKKRFNAAKNQILIDELIKIKIYDKVGVSDEEAKKFYDTHQQELSRVFKGKGFEEIKQNIKQIIKRDNLKARLLFKKWIEELKKEATITKNLALLGTIEK